MPINERRIAGREISVKPEGHAHQLDNPTNDNCLAQAIARCRDTASRLSRHDGMGLFKWRRHMNHASSRPATIFKRSQNAKRKTASRRSLRNPIRCFDQAATIAAAFRFLRQPSRPNAPRPVAKSGRAAGSGVVPLLPPPLILLKAKPITPVGVPAVEPS